MKVSGEIGSGKTTLCRVLMERLPPEVEIVFLANPSYSRTEILHAIAEDVAKRTAHKVVALEVLRSDGYLEFVAIAGDEDARAKMMGQASPLELGHIRRLGQEMDGWWHVPNEVLDDTTRAWLDQYGHRPDVPASDLPDGWDPDDQLVRLLEDRKSTRLNSSHSQQSRMPSSA